MNIRTIVHIVTMALLGALVGGFVALVAVSEADAAKPDPIDRIPSLDDVFRVEGTKARGFRVWRVEPVAATYALLDPRRRMMRECVRAHGDGTDKASACQEAWRGYYDALVVIRNQSKPRDYWPYPGPVPQGQPQQP